MGKCFGIFQTAHHVKGFSLLISFRQMLFICIHYILSSLSAIRSWHLSQSYLSLSSFPLIFSLKKQANFLNKDTIFQTIKFTAISFIAED